MLGFLHALPAPIRRMGKSVPRPLKDLVLATVNFFWTIPYWGKGRYCPLCGRSSKEFAAFGLVLRADSQCVYCGSLERHRLVWLYLQRKTDLLDGLPKKVLHIAPEIAFMQPLRRRFGKGYITADLLEPWAMVKMDITDIQFPDNTFDFIFCSHVLEHVPDDRRAMREFYRTLKPGGWSVLMVPILQEHTFEDPSIVNPSQRLAVFGQSDHVRIYGRDFADRLKEAGFEVRVTVATDFLSRQEIVTMACDNAGEIFHCIKN